MIAERTSKTQEPAGACGLHMRGSTRQGACSWLSGVGGANWAAVAVGWATLIKQAPPLPSDKAGGGNHPAALAAVTTDPRPSKPSCTPKLEIFCSDHHAGLTVSPATAAAAAPALPGPALRQAQGGGGGPSDAADSVFARQWRHQGHQHQVRGASGLGDASRGRLPQTHIAPLPCSQVAREHGAASGEGAAAGAARRHPLVHGSVVRD